MPAAPAAPGPARPAPHGDDPRVVRTREHVLAATAALLAEHGFERTTIDAVAERSGVARSTIYRHWPERGHLLVDAFASASPRLVDVDTGSLAGDLRAVARLLRDHLGASPMSAALPSLFGAARHDPTLRDAARRFSRERRTQLRALLERARERGEIGPGHDLDLAVVRFVGPFFYRALLADEPVTEAFAAAVVRATLTELSAPTQP